MFTLGERVDSSVEAAEISGGDEGHSLVLAGVRVRYRGFESHGWDPTEWG